MTKKAMIDEMVAYGCISKTDRNYLMKRSKKDIEELYNEAIPLRKAHLEKNA